MNYDHLKLYVDVILAKSVSRGAVINHISQSAASQHIQELEKRFGVVLLDRSRRPFTVTAAGRLYYEMARDILRRKEAFEVALEDLVGAVERTVRVAAIYSVGLSEMSQLEEKFSDRFPQARLQVEYLQPARIYEAVLTDQVDLGLLAYPDPSRALTVIAWREEVMAVAAAPSHALAAKKAVAPSDLNGLGFVALDEDLPIRRKVDQFLRDQGVQVRVTFHFDNIQMVKEAVALGRGMSILPVRVMNPEILQGRLVAIPLESPGLVRPLGIIHRRRKRFNRAAQAFLELLLEAPSDSPSSVVGPVPPA